MGKYKMYWYDQDEVKFIEFALMEADSEEDAIKKLRIKYNNEGRKEHAPCIYAKKVG